MNFHGIETDSMVNGSGLRVVLWVSGCSHYCKECQNPQTWDSESGRPFTNNDMMDLLMELDKDYISGLTLSGGDPLYPENRDTILRLCKVVKRALPDKTIWLYTGYRYNEVKDLEIINYIDVIVDGEFVKELADIKYHWAGSTNQRVIDIKKSKQYDGIVLLED